MSDQVEQHQIKKSSPWWNYCETVCFSSKNLFNTAQYSNRQSFIYGHGVMTQGAMDKLFNSDVNYQSLPAKVSQLVLKQVADSWTSYFAALKAWSIDPSKFTGKPKAPGYIDVIGRNLIKFNKQAISKTAFKKGFIAPSMSPIQVPVKPGLKLDDIVEVRLIPKVGCYILEVVYDDRLSNQKTIHKGLSAAIDIGIDNLATIVFSDPTIQPLAVNGKPLKAKNQWFNNFVHSYLHQSTAKIAAELSCIGVTEVAIGKNPQWKTECNMGTQNNQQFVQIPHTKFILMLTQKLEKLGITVKVDEESYTSKASFLDWDTIPTWQPGKSNKTKFSGKRIATKKYCSQSGAVIHADVNGAFNIGRKVIPNSFDCIKLIVERNRGCVVAHPRRINIPFQMTKVKDMSGSAHI
jgi:IS605 OrfB family transposase